MATLDVYNLSKEKVGSAELDDAIFASEVKEHLFWEIVRAQLAARRAGTHSTKGRAEIRGSIRKPFRQKGTGRARQGDLKSPTMRSGGVAMGPKPRDYSYNVPKTAKKAALKSALSRRNEESKLWVVENFDMPEIKTRSVRQIAEKFGWSTVLIVDERNDALRKSAKNLPNVRYLSREGLNVYDILNHEHLVITQAAVASITGALTK